MITSTISRVEPSLQAAFVNFGRERHGFLAFNDIQSDYYQLPSEDKEKIRIAEEKIREELKDKANEINSENHQNSPETSDEEKTKSEALIENKEIAKDYREEVKSSFDIKDIKFKKSLNQVK